MSIYGTMVLEDASSLIGLWVFLGVLAVGAIVGAVFIVINGVKDGYVYSTSEYIQAIHRINQKYHFEDVPMKEYVTIPLHSKRSFDNFNISKRFDWLVENNIGYFKELARKIEWNISAYGPYVKEIYGVSPCTDEALAKKGKMSLQTYNKKELAMGEELFIKPKMDYSLEMTWEYTSPAGKSHYSGSWTFSYQTVKCSLSKLASKSQSPSKAKARF